MLDSFKAFFKQNVQPAPAESEAPDDSQHRLHLAAAALLLELAYADDEFTDDERDHIQKALMRHFDLSQEQADEIMRLADAERRESVDLYQFAGLITKNYDEGQRMVLAEVMWGVVHADGELSKHEHYLMEKFSRLLDLRPGYLAEAKKRALGKE